MHKRICAACDASIEHLARTARYCSERCRTWCKRHPGAKIPTGRACKRCGVNIDHKSMLAFFCSEHCGEVARGEVLAERRASPCTCVVCGTGFVAGSSLGKYCTPSCRSRAKLDRMREAYGDGGLAARRARERQRARARRLQDPGLMAAYLTRRAKAQRDREARKALAPTVPFTEQQLRARLSMYVGCWLCGREATTIDHVKPISRGGSHMLANLRPACGPCNSGKRDRWPLEDRCLGGAQSTRASARRSGGTSSTG